MSITYERIVRLLKANLLIIIAVAILCFGATFAYMRFIVAPVYYSTAKFYVETTKESTSISLSEVNYKRAMVDTYLAILDSNEFYQEVYLSLTDGIRAEYSSSAIKRHTTISSVNGTEVMSVTFNCGEPATAKAITEAIVNKVQDRIQKTISTCSVRVTDVASEPAISGDKTRLTSIIAMLIGAVAVFCIALIRDLVDSRIKTSEDITDKFNIPVLGIVPSFRAKVVKGATESNGK